MTTVRDPLVMIVLLALTGVGFLNLLLLLRVFAIVRPIVPTIGLPPGSPIPPAATIAFADATRLDRWPLPAAFIFLSPGCRACSEAVPKAEALIPAANRARLGLKVVVDADGTDGRAWLGPFLAARVISLPRRSYRRLNPHGAVPSYLFVDEHGFVQASGHIGDEGWRTLEEQLGT